MKTVSLLLIGALLAAMSDAWLVPWLQGLTFIGASEGFRSAGLSLVHYVTYPVELSALTIALSLAFVCYLLRALWRLRPPIPQLVQDSISEEELKRLMALAQEQETHGALVRHDDGTTEMLRSVPVDGFSQGERTFMRVLALIDLKPIQMHMAAIVFGNSNIAMASALQSLQSKGLIVVGNDIVTLSANGIQWAQQQLNRGLGKPAADMEPIRVHQSTGMELTVTDEQRQIVTLLARQDGSMVLDQLRTKSRLSMVRLEHEIDKLQDMNLVRRHPGGYGLPGVSLTSKGRSYAVGHNLDRGLKTP